jgi:hypothetical protein
MNNSMMDLVMSQKIQENQNNVFFFQTIQGEQQ